MPKLKCTNCSKTFSFTNQLQRCEECNEPLEVVYDELSVSKRAFNSNQPLLSKYQNLIPFESPNPELYMGEGETPLLKANPLSDDTGVKNLNLKDESTNPTGSFKDRGTSYEVQSALFFGSRA